MSLESCLQAAPYEHDLVYFSYCFACEYVEYLLF